jgi:hypothetical protein
MARKKSAAVDLTAPPAAKADTTDTALPPPGSAAHKAMVLRGEAKE